VPPNSDPPAKRPFSPVDAEGPWRHRDVAANGARFHVVEAGSGPLVVLLHGFPEFWWAWRHQLPALADAGYRAVAMDLRGYGGSDKPPNGYDPTTLTADVAGVIRSLGEARATIVGHGLGGFVGWSAAVLAPQHVNRLAVIAAPHPLLLRATRSRRASEWAQLTSYQLPVIPERNLLAHGAAEVEHMLRRWSGPGWPDSTTAMRYREAIQLWPTPHCALEYHRWLARSWLRTDGRRYSARMATPVDVPVLQIHGALDRAVRPDPARRSESHVTGSYRWRLLGGVGHFPHEEAPDLVSSELIDWLDATKDAV
jgi:pimeloyl-ACP methyl ester carboxylesterase